MNRVYETLRCLTHGKRLQILLLLLYNMLILLLYFTVSLITAFTLRIILKNRCLAEFNFSSIKCQALAHPVFAFQTFCSQPLGILKN